MNRQNNPLADLYERLNRGHDGMRESLLAQLRSSPEDMRLHLQRPSRRMAFGTARAVTRTAAGLLIAGSLLIAAIWLIPFGAGPKVAFAQVQDALRQVKTAVITLKFPNRPELTQTIYVRDTNQFRQQYASGLVRIHDGTKRKILGMNPQDKTAWFTPAPESANPPWAFVERFLKIEQSAVGSLGSRKFDGKTLIGFRIAPKGQKTDAPSGVRWEAWIDPDTRLPVRVEETPVDADDPETAHRRMIAEFEFNTPIEASLFRMTPPKDFRMVEQGPLVPLPAPSKEVITSAVITPGVGVGEARFGMPLKQVVDRLGPPSELWYVYADPKTEYHTRMKEVNRDLLAYNLKYKDRGYSLRIKPRDGFALITTKQGVVDSGVFGFRAFTGRTKQGIRLGATRKEIEKTYGLPSKVRGSEGEQFALIYKQKGLVFLLDAGRLTLIQAWKPDNNQSFNRLWVVTECYSAHGVQSITRDASDVEN